jgi:hypothetical protein
MGKTNSYCYCNWTHHLWALSAEAVEPRCKGTVAAQPVRPEETLEAANTPTLMKHVIIVQQGNKMNEIKLSVTKK